MAIDEKRTDIVPGGKPVNKPPIPFTRTKTISTTARAIMDITGANGPFMVKQAEIIVSSMGTAAHVYIGEKSEQPIDLTAVNMSYCFEIADGSPFNLNDIFVKADVGTTTKIVIVGFRAV